MPTKDEVDTLTVFIRHSGEAWTLVVPAGSPEAGREFRAAFRDAAGYRLTVRSDGTPTIDNPGKFEGCPWWAPYFHRRMIESDQADLAYDGDTPISYFNSALDRAIVGLPEWDTIGLACYEDDSGFFRYSLPTQSQWEATKEACEAQESGE